MPGWAWACVAAAVVLAAALIGFDRASRRPPELSPRHRAEALCFALAAPPEFAPAMAVQPSAALVRGRFNADTPAGFALQRTMHFSDEMVLKQWSRRVGDFDVSAFWLDLPGSANEHWLVLAWMEGADLAVCSFRFAAQGPRLGADERQWGMRLLERVLRPEYFRAGTLPGVRLRVAGSETLPTFGPKPGG